MKTKQNKTDRAEIYERSFHSEPNFKIVLVGVFGLLGIVFLIIKLGDDPPDLSSLPEDAILAGFTWVPSSGPWLGIDVRGSETRNLSWFIQSGRVTITRVLRGSPAERAGLRPGYIIEKVDNHKISEPKDLRNAIMRHNVGDTMTLLVSKEHFQGLVSVVLGTRSITSSQQGVLAAATAPVDAAAKPWFGADIQPIDELMANRFSLANTNGVIVSHVYPSSPANKSGLIQGDVIQKVNDVNIVNLDQIGSIIDKCIPGDPLSLTVLSGGVQRNLRLTLGVRPPQKKIPQPTLPEAVVEIEATWLGLNIVPLTKAEAEELGVNGNLNGMVVDAVTPGKGMDFGFQVGDVIIAVNGKPAGTTKEFKEATESAAGALIDVIRGGRHLYISIPPPGGSTGQGADGLPVRQVEFKLW